MICRYVDQGGGKRKGAFAVYLEPWHADIFDWLNLRKNHGKEEVNSDDTRAYIYGWKGGIAFPHLPQFCP